MVKRAKMQAVGDLHRKKKKVNGHEQTRHIYEAEKRPGNAQSKLKTNQSETHTPCKARIFRIPSTERAAWPRKKIENWRKQRSGKSLKRKKLWKLWRSCGHCFLELELLSWLRARLASLVTAPSVAAAAAMLCAEGSLSAKE